MARITLTHGDPDFADPLAAALRAEGHEVITDPSFMVRPLRETDALEIAITQAIGRRPGLRIRVTGVPRDRTYGGAWAQILADPVTVADTMQALSLFIGLASQPPGTANTDGGNHGIVG